MFLWKRGSCEYQHCRCLARIAIALNCHTVFGQIQYTKPPEHLYLLNNITVGSSSVLTWSCYMIGVILIFQSLHQWNTFPWCLHHVCLPGYRRINYSSQLSQSGICGRWCPQKWTKGGSYSRRSLPFLPNPPLFPLPSYPLPLSTPAMQAKRNSIHLLCKLLKNRTSKSRLISYLGGSWLSKKWPSFLQHPSHSPVKWW